MKVAVVGMGHFGPLRLEALARVAAGLELVACDHHPHKLESIARRIPGLATRDRFEDLLADDTVTAIVLSTPIGTHAELGLAALQTGKHLFVEKPLATTVQDAERLIEAAQSRGLVLSVGHSFDESSPALALSRLLSTEVLGTLHYASMRRVNFGRHQRDSSVLWDLAVHDVSLVLRWMKADPSRVQLHGRSVATASQLEVAFLNLAFPNGFLAQIECSWVAPTKARLIQLVGAHAVAEYRASDDGESLTLCERRVVMDGGEPEYQPGDTRAIALEPHAALDREMQRFLGAITANRPSAEEAEHALRVVRVLAAAEASWSPAG